MIIFALYLPFDGLQYLMPLCAPFSLPTNPKAMDEVARFQAQLRRKWKRQTMIRYPDLSDEAEVEDLRKRLLRKRSSGMLLIFVVARVFEQDYLEFSLALGTFIYFCYEFKFTPALLFNFRLKIFIY